MNYAMKGLMLLVVFVVANLTLDTKTQSGVIGWGVVAMGAVCIFMWDDIKRQLGIGGSDEETETDEEDGEAQ